MSEMNSLTLNGNKYDSFVDQTAREEIEKIKDSGQNVTLTTAQINALDSMFKVCAYDDSKDVSGAYATFKTAFGITDSGEEEPDEPVVPEVTLTSISAEYSGGDVTVGTAVADLTGIVVTAHYSDGSTETVSGYTLSGTIAEGSNTVTVSYGGKTTTFSVTGVAESGGEDAVQYGLYIPASNTGVLVTTPYNGLNRMVWDGALPSVSATTVHFKVISAWMGTSSSGFTGVMYVSSDKTFAEIADAGRQTVDFTINTNNANASFDIRNWSGMQGEMTIYRISLYADDTLLGDITPTAKLGEMYDSVKDMTFTWTDTTGMELLEVTE